MTEGERLKAALDALAQDLARLDGRETLANYINARITQLRDDMEELTLGRRKTIQLRGRIAELRGLMEKLYPKASATPDLDRPPLY